MIEKSAYQTVVNDVGSVLLNRDNPVSHRRCSYNLTIDYSLSFNLKYSFLVVFPVLQSGLFYLRYQADGAEV